MWSLAAMGVEAANVTSWPRPLQLGCSARMACRLMSGSDRLALFLPGSSNAAAAWAALGDRWGRMDTTTPPELEGRGAGLGWAETGESLLLASTAALLLLPSTVSEEEEEATGGMVPAGEATALAVLRGAAAESTPHALPASPLTWLPGLAASGGCPAGAALEEGDEDETSLMRLKPSAVGDDRPATGGDCRADGGRFEPGGKAEDWSTDAAGATWAGAEPKEADGSPRPP